MNIDNLGICHLAVGQTIDRFKGTLMDGCSIDIENNITTYVVMNGLDEKKIKAFTEGKITFGVAEVDDIMIVLLEIENLIESDMAFQINLYPVQYRMVADEFKDGTGYATFLALVDGMTGKVVALRAVGLGTKISNTIRGLIQGQMTTEAYDNRAFSFKLREYYRRNTIADTKKKCLVSYVCGTLEETSSK